MLNLSPRSNDQTGALATLRSCPDCQGPVVICLNGMQPTIQFGCVCRLACHMLEWLLRGWGVQAGPDAADLLDKLLKFDPHERCSVEEVWMMLACREPDMAHACCMQCTCNP